MNAPSEPPEAHGDRITLPGREPRSMPPIVRDPPPLPPIFTAIAAGIAIARSRLARRGTLVAASLALALSAASALIERSAGTSGAVDRALAGSFGLVIPIFAFWVVGAVIRGRLADAAWPAARFGLARREVALGIVIAAAAAAAVGAALCAVVSVALASSPSAPIMVSDAALSAWIGVLVATVYVAWFAFGATFLRFGGGSAIILVVDFVIGGSTGIAGAILPRGNAANLLGGAAPLGLTQPSSTAIVVASSVVLGIAAALRSGD